MSRGILLQMLRGIALLLTSTCYFYVWSIFYFANSINSKYEPELGGMFAALSLLILSVIGSLIFVALNKKKSDKWFLGLPLFIIFLTLLLCLYVSGMLYVTSTSSITGLMKLTPIINLHVPAELFVLPLVFVAPASLLFIKSMPEDLRESTKKYVKVAKVVSVYAAIIGLLYFIDNLLLIDNSLVYVMLIIYMAFGLPPIGICLVLMARKFILSSVNEFYAQLWVVVQK
jgi:hypothetical protein